MSYVVQGVRLPDLSRAWPEVSPLLADALARNCRGYTLADVRAALEGGEAMLWVVRAEGRTDAAVVSYIDAKPGDLVVWLMGGRGMKSWLGDLIAALRRYAVEAGLNGVQAHVRPGLAKVLAGHGWAREHITMRTQA